MLIEPVKNAEGRWIFPGLEAAIVMRAGHRMLGVFTTAELKKGDKFEYFGRKMNKEQYTELVKEERKKQTPNRLAYIVQLKNDLYLDAYHKSPFGVAHNNKCLGGQLMNQDLN
jgi:hypothetical protein